MQKWTYPNLQKKVRFLRIRYISIRTLFKSNDSFDLASFSQVVRFHFIKGKSEICWSVHVHCLAQSTTTSTVWKALYLENAAHNRLFSLPVVHTSAEYTYLLEIKKKINKRYIVIKGVYLYEK